MKLCLKGAVVVNPNFALGVVVMAYADSTNRLAIHNGIPAGEPIGYKVIQAKSFTTAPVLGFSTTANVVSAPGENSIQIYHAVIYKHRKRPPKGGIFFEHTTSVNMPFEIKAGYDYSLNQSHDRSIEGSMIKIDIINKKGDFFINLVIGEPVSLKHYSIHLI